jgi:DNA-binding ferritin-like protein
MPTEDEVQSGMEPVAIKDPYTGLHAESIYAIWHDPTTYDMLRHGPPYLPEPVKIGKVASGASVLKDEIRPLVEKMGADAMTSMLVIIQHIKADFADMPMSMMAVLLAFLRAESMVHQAHHWQTRGESYYGDHLLFERLYTAVVEDIDKVAERMVGSGHHILAQPVFHAKHTSAVVQCFYGDAPPNPTSDEYVLISLRAALRTLVVLKIVYASLEHAGLLSHGTDNLLQGVADKHEEQVYLLKQRATQKTSAYYDRRKVATSDPRWKSG